MRQWAREHLRLLDFPAHRLLPRQPSRVGPENSETGRRYWSAWKGGAAIPRQCAAVARRAGRTKYQSPERAQPPDRREFLRPRRASGNICFPRRYRRPRQCRRCRTFRASSQRAGRSRLHHSYREFSWRPAASSRRSRGDAAHARHFHQATEESPALRFRPRSGWRAAPSSARPPRCR